MMHTLHLRRSGSVIRYLPAALLLLACGCAATPGPERFKPGTPLQRAGDEIMVCGRFYHTGAPVVLWFDPGGYDAYRAECKWIPDRIYPTHAGDDAAPYRYGTFRRNIPEDVKEHVRNHGWDLDLLQNYVDLFVLHYDVCGTSKRCFQVLQDMRGLSVHFMLDLDGTIYQTLDLKERAWHAGTANDRSVGIEIANMGAYENLDEIADWYDRDENGRLYVTIPERFGDGGIRTPDFVAYPSRNEPVSGNIQGRDLHQYDFTDEQYDSLIRLTATLCQIFPKLACDYPRDAEGNLRTTKLTDEEMAAFSGIIGHWHVTTAKVDPGPALDWDRVIDGARQEMGP